VIEPGETFNLGHFFPMDTGSVRAMKESQL
jgi:hypothetical protein